MTTPDIDQPATRRDLLELRSELRGELRGEIGGLRNELRGEINSLRSDLTAQILQLHTHFDVVAESFRADFRNLFDWTQATTSSLGGRLDVVERDHGKALNTLDLRVRSLENTPR